MKTLLMIIIAFVALPGVAQIKAKAIAYNVEIDLKKFDPVNGKGLDDALVKFETDAYYSDTNVRTFNRRTKVVEDYNLTLRQRYYDQSSIDEYNVDHDNKFVVKKEGHAYKPKSTGKTKTILNYACKEYSVTDFQGRQLYLWVTDKLGKNVCPWGNFQVKGTVLALTSSFGVSFQATDFAEGIVDSNFFDVPVAYQMDKIPFPADRKK